jgi:hypothetical protein
VLQNRISNVCTHCQTVIQSTSQVPNSRDSRYLGDIRAHFLYFYILIHFHYFYYSIFSQKVSAPRVPPNRTSSVCTHCQTVIQDTSQVPNSRDSGYLGVIRAHFLYFYILILFHYFYYSIFTQKVSAPRCLRIAPPASAHTARPPFRALLRRRIRRILGT